MTTVRHGSTPTVGMHVATAAAVNVVTERLAPALTGAGGLMPLDDGSSCTGERRRHTGLTALLQICEDLCRRCLVGMLQMTHAAGSWNTSLGRSTISGLDTATARAPITTDIIVSLTNFRTLCHGGGATRSVQASDSELSPRSQREPRPRQATVARATVACHLYVWSSCRHQSSDRPTRVCRPIDTHVTASVVNSLLSQGRLPASNIKLEINAKNFSV